MAYELLTSYPCFLVARFMLPFGLIFFGACCILDDESFGRIRDLWFTDSCVVLLSGIQACVQKIPTSIFPETSGKN